MKKVLGIICSFLFMFIVITGCSCKKEDEKVSLGIGDVNATTYQTISVAEFDTKVKNKDNFILYVYSETCNGCIAFKPIIEKVIKDKDLTIYGVTAYSIPQGHQLKAVEETPTILLYNKGELKVSINSTNNNEYFKNDAGFISFLDKYTNMPTMYYINKDQLVEKINNDENFIIYYSRNDCGDCAYMYNYFLKDYLYNNPNTKKIYVIETTTEGIRLTNGVVNSVQWQAFKDQFGLSKTGNSTYGYGVGYVPTIQYYSNGELADMVVYFNDLGDYITNSDGSYSLKINESYYSDNPYLGQTILYSDYKTTLASFYNEKLTTFLNNNLGLVD